MTIEEKFAALEAKLEAQEVELAAIRRGAAGGIPVTGDTSGRNMHGLSAARSVTIATRPVRDSPELYRGVIWDDVSVKKDEEGE